MNNKKGKIMQTKWSNIGRNFYRNRHWELTKKQRKLSIWSTCIHHIPGKTNTRRRKKQMDQRKQSQFDLYYISGKMAHKTAYPKG